MYNDRKIISASEVNKYTYCEYSWYYERLYGAKYIREKQKELYGGMEKYTKNNLKKGTKFHNTYLLKRKLILIAKLFIIAIVISCIIYIYLL